MKTLTKLSVAAFAVVAAASCSKEIQNIESQLPSTGIAKVPVTFTATLDDATKGFISGQTPTWEVGDSLVIYDNIAIEAASSGAASGTIVKPAIDTFRVVQVSGNTVTICGNISEGSTSFFAAYPFSAASGVYAASDSLSVAVPATQTIPAGKNIDPKALVSVAKSTDGTFAFKNVVSLVKMTISQDNASSIIMAGTNAETFVGTNKTSSVSACPGEVNTCGGTRLTVLPQDAVFAKGDIYAAVFPSSFANGFALSVATGEKARINRTEKAVTFPRNGGLNLGKVDTGTEMVSEIATYADLKAFASLYSFYGINSVVKVVADIDCNGATEEWVNPTGSFLGTFDGQNHRIYNIVQTKNSVDGSGQSGLFSTLGSGAENDPACVKNLCVGSKDYNFDTKTGTYDGVSKFTLSTCGETATGYKYVAVVPYAHNYSIVKNVVNFVPIAISKENTIRHRGAGVCGTVKANVLVEDCINFGSVTDNMEVWQDAGSEAHTVGSTIAGITGAIDGANSIIKNCINRGDVVNYSTFIQAVGGIAGVASYAGCACINCVNYGTIDLSATCDPVSGTGYANRVGGIIGSSKASGIIYDKCENYGNISCSAPCGKTSSSAQTCVGIGGISGVIASSAVLKGCKNAGTVGYKGVSPVGNFVVGGVVGYTTGSSTILTMAKADDDTWNINEGTVLHEMDFTGTTTAYFGGVVGYHNGNVASVISYCENKGVLSVSGDNNHPSGSALAVCLGGIIGQCGSSTLGEISNCKFSGEVKALKGGNRFLVGGIFGASNAPGKIVDCESSGKLTVAAGTSSTTSSTDATRIGGIMGTFTFPSTVLKNCKFTGTIVDTTPGAVHFTGGIAAWVALSKTGVNGTNCEGCESKGTITPTAETVTAGWAGAGFGNLSKQTSVKQAATFGSAENPIKIGGTFNGTAITSDNYTSFIYGSSNTSVTMFAKCSFNTAFAE